MATISLLVRVHMTSISVSSSVPRPCWKKGMNAFWETVCLETIKRKMTMASKEEGGEKEQGRERERERERDDSLPWQRCEGWWRRRGEWVASKPPAASGSCLEIPIKISKKGKKEHNKKKCTHTHITWSLWAQIVKQVTPVICVVCLRGEKTNEENRAQMWARKRRRVV